MTRHLADAPRRYDDGQRLARFLRIARAEGPGAAVRALHARRPAAAAESRLAPILRVLRGRAV